MAGLPEPLYEKLKPGPGKSSKAVFANQRARLSGAMVEFAAERGYEAVTVRGLGGLAGISTGTFYKHFANAEQCFGHAYERLMRSSLRRARVAQSRSEDWEMGVRAALQSVLDDLSRNPKAAQVVLVEAYAAGPAMHPRMRQEIAGFERLLATSSAPESVASSGPIRRGIAAAVLHVARTRLLSGQIARLPEDGSQLGDWIVSLSSEQAVGTETSDSSATLAAEAARRRAEDLRRAIGGPLGSEDGRVLAAVAKLTATGGFSKLTVPRIRAEAGVSRRHLDDRFEGTEGCFLAMIEAIATHAGGRAAETARQTDDWAAGIDAAVRRLCEEIACNPSLAHLFFVEILAPGRRGLRCRDRLVCLAAGRLRAATPQEHRPSVLFAEASTAAAWQILCADIEARRAGATPRLAPLLVHLSLRPRAAYSSV